MSVAHKAAPKTMRELSLDDLQVNYAVMVNNAITEGRSNQVATIVRSYNAQRNGLAPLNRSLWQRFLDYIEA
ncbi:MAG: hypothetical protein F2839_06560 [Actinobacteria bacterium]|uniref:Unannotated protein n=1 Tax=freshwater metagenome TaxID=449393 RepID=A0A6J5ZWP8_9ZZZZ|nr:hypothetical protein [Actinomycetota bacterium]